jgi:hypothetical protein
MEKESEDKMNFGNKYSNEIFIYCTEKRVRHLYYMRMRNEKDRECFGKILRSYESTNCTEKRESHLYYIRLINNKKGGQI